MRAFYNSQEDAASEIDYLDLLAPEVRARLETFRMLPPEEQQRRADEWERTCPKDEAMQQFTPRKQIFKRAEGPKENKE